MWKGREGVYIREEVVDEQLQYREWTYTLGAQLVDWMTCEARQRRGDIVRAGRGRRGEMCRRFPFSDLTPFNGFSVSVWRPPTTGWPIECAWDVEGCAGAAGWAGFIALFVVSPAFTSSTSIVRIVRYANEASGEG